jgi:ectoine hydroxylase-related dioxygenase (phytanoyl-CoA dioxygenase family)
MNKEILIDDFNSKGYIIINDVYNDHEVESIIDMIAGAPTNNETFRKTKDLFAIRQFIKEVPEVSEWIFNRKIKDLIVDLFGEDFFVTKSIYFDKPAQSNWFVAYHQDLTISVDKKVEIPGYGPWTVKQDQFAVQPPLDILQNNFTIRIHLDDTDEFNGALNVITGSNNKGIYRAETIDFENETEETCCVQKGGVMIMRPLLLHSSARSINNEPRRVIHMEFSNAELSDQINWSEKYQF